MTPEDVARYPFPGTNNITNVSFSPDDSMLSYLHAEGSQMHRQLWGINLSTLGKKQLVVPPNAGDTEDNLSLEEKLRRERQRMHAVGITSYQWTARGCDKERIIVPLQGNLYVQDGIDISSLRVLYNKDVYGDHQGAIDPQISPDGSMVAFVRSGDIYIVLVDEINESMDDISSKNSGQIPMQVTFGATTTLTHGLADFVAQEEMERFRGFWWSPDSKSIAFTEVDESHIPTYRIMHQGKDTVDSTTQEDHQYPFAGKDNPKVKLGVITVDIEKLHKLQEKSLGEESVEFKPIWMDTLTGPSGDDSYLARVMWLPDGFLCAQVQSREQDLIQVLRLDPASGSKLVLLEEKCNDNHWINLHHLMRTFNTPIHPSDVPGNAFLFMNAGSFSFLWGSERSGYMHLYLYTFLAGEKQARLVCQLTSGNWVVESIVGVNPERNALYVVGTYDSPCERHLYVVTLDGFSESEVFHQTQVVDKFPIRRSPVVSLCTPKRLTTESGMHNVVMNHSMSHFVDIFSTSERPAKTVLCRLAENPFDLPETVHELHTAMDERVIALRHKLKPPHIYTIRSRDNAVDLYLGVYRPDSNVHGPGPYPTIVSVYGGPHLQMVTKSWGTTVDMRAQRLRDLGFLVVKCDNRGSSRRGLDFECWIKDNMGSIEVKDQEDAVRHLVAEGLADPMRIGIYGWSYGGYMALMCLCKASNTFKVGVSGAPVTSWDGYDTHYTERYMSTPGKNSKGYFESSVLTHVTNMQGKLLLVHGLIDENVHFRHTARLINSLISSRKHYDLLLFPDERHSPRRLQDRVYMEERISDYFIQHLMRIDSIPMPPNVIALQSSNL